ncbi:DinB family protein [Gryllotalpicola ginsengisoli]|uniref:DinB family protein n=1 Tax=Gryllotalpicola ginsengisoli TaxID=444608 RepID=UPI0003B6FCC5|nr:DinB family protein [Gryllotalpicola ginsengisoli]
MDDDEKAMLLHYLQRHRDAMVWKLDGLTEREARWPATPTGTNLLGLVKHLAHVEYGYFGQVFDRPVDDPLFRDLDEAEVNADMWATADESRDDIVGFYRRAWANTDAAVAALSLDAAGFVPWWGPERGHATLRRVLVHVVQETARHAGHADIVREGLDGQAGLSPAVSNLPEQDAAWWADYVSRLKVVAEQAGPGRTE